MSIAPDAYETQNTAIYRRIVAASPAPPGSDIVAALESGTVNVVRRVEVFESDGITPWNPELVNEKEFRRLIEGSVTVDYSADERRKFDVTLDNRDKLLRPNPNDGFWYDKVLKPFWGIQFTAGEVPPRMAIVEAPGLAVARILARILNGLGFTDVDIILDADSLDDVKPHTFLVSYAYTAATTKSTFLESAWNAGKHILTIGVKSNETHLPHYLTSSVVAVNHVWGIEPTGGDSPVAGAFVAESQPGVATSGSAPQTLAQGVVPLALWEDDTSDETYGAAIATSTAGTYWTDLHTHLFDYPDTKKFLRAILNYMRAYGQLVHWETQLGEFMIDGISEANFPNAIRVTCRDYTKKLMMSKFAHNTTFAVGTSLRDMVIALAVNGGIDPNKIRVAIGGEVLTSEMAYSRGTDRWSVIKAACSSYNYEVFFDAFGWFVVRSFVDPTTSPISWTFKTGSDGNLVSFEKSISDSEIYNIVVVTSQPSDNAQVMPYIGIARNDDPNSPTSTVRMNSDRVLTVEANYLNSNAECVALAKNRLKIVGLEQYNLNQSMTVYPWLEVGEVTEHLDPDALDFEPTRYLLDSLSFGMALGPMSGTAKRVTLVGDPGNATE